MAGAEALTGADVSWTNLAAPVPFAWAEVEVGTAIQPARARAVSAVAIHLGVEINVFIVVCLFWFLLFPAISSTATKWDYPAPAETPLNLLENIFAGFEPAWCNHLRES
jgi:hypothetical protein